MRQTLISRTSDKLMTAIIAVMPNASDNLVFGIALMAIFTTGSSLAGMVTAILQLLGVTSVSWITWAILSVIGGGFFTAAIVAAYQKDTLSVILLVAGYLAVFTVASVPILYDNLSGWLVLGMLVAGTILLAQAVCQIYPGFCRRGRRILQAKVWPGIKESFRFMKVNLKRSGRNIARWWRNDAKPWLSAARTRVYTWFTTTALPWIEKAFKWFFGLLWEYKWAVLAIGGAYLAYELYNPRKGEWYEVWRQSWWWIASLTAAVVGTLFWLPDLRKKLFELTGEGIGVVAGAYRAHYNGIAGGWKALYWISLLGTPAATWWLWSNYHRQGLWLIVLVGVVCFVVAHAGEDGDAAAKKLADAWEKGGKAKPAKS